MKLAERGLKKAEVEYSNCKKFKKLQDHRILLGSENCINNSKQGVNNSNGSAAIQF